MRARSKGSRRTNLVPVGLGADLFDVGGGDLESVEEQAGLLGVDLVVHDGPHDLHQGELDGVAVLEEGDVGLVTLADTVVEVEEVFASEGRGAAADSVEFDVVALGDIRVDWHRVSP
jgi:hypothetical protein